MKAVLNVMEGIDREIVSKVQHLFNMDTEGKVKYDWKAARSSWPPTSGPRRRLRPLSVVNSFCTNVAHIISDIVRRARHRGPEGQVGARFSQDTGRQRQKPPGLRGHDADYDQLVNVKDITPA